MNQNLFDAMHPWSRGYSFTGAAAAADKLSEALPRMSKAQAAVVGTICATGGYDVTAFKAGSLGSLLATGLIVVYKGMAYPIDVWE
jgi:hypothetical protein